MAQILTSTFSLCLWFFTKVGKTMPCLPCPRHQFCLKGGTEIPFPVMGGKNMQKLHCFTHMIAFEQITLRHVFWESSRLTANDVGAMANSCSML